jgi:hypothetical protein
MPRVILAYNLADERLAAAPRPGLLGFWALYFAIVALSNLTDLLGSLHLLPAGCGIDGIRVVSEDVLRAQLDRSPIASSCRVSGRTTWARCATTSSGTAGGAFFATCIGA